MTKPKRANNTNLPPHWKVRICLRHAAILHVLCETEPIVREENGVIQNVEIEYITGTEHGDTIGFIDWREVGAISWRFAPLATA